MNINSILPVDYNNRNVSFQAKRNDYITKKTLEVVTPKNVVLPVAAAAIAGAAATIEESEKILKSNGITYVKNNGENVNIAAGYNGGFYTIKLAPTANAKNYIAVLATAFISGDVSSLGGLVNYMNMVRDIKRQDIIQKGLKIHTYELNNSIPLDIRLHTAAKMAKATQLDILEKDLFYIENEAFYYDRNTKTAYYMNLPKKNDYTKPFVNTCKFIINDYNSAIGYQSDSWDSYSWNKVKKEYMEQQRPSAQLPSVAEQENNKYFAESFRFGNAEIKNSSRVKEGIPIVLEHISNKLKIYGLDDDRLQFVKFYDDQDRVQTRICYYDSTLGTSMVYDTNGNYLYQMEYNKDSEGNIYSCAKF